MAEPWTPGPWEAVKRKDGYDHDFWDVKGPEGEFLAGGSIYHQGPANARLIAAAPEMADTITNLLKHAGICDQRHYSGDGSSCKYVRDAADLAARIRGEAHG